MIVPTTSYPNTMKTSYSAAKGNIPNENGTVWQNMQLPQTLVELYERDVAAGGLRGAGQSSFISSLRNGSKIIDPGNKLIIHGEGVEDHDIIEAVEVPITRDQLEHWSTREDKLQTRQTLSGSSNTSSDRPMRREVPLVVEKDITFPVLRPTAGAAGKEAVCKSRKTMSPQTAGGKKRFSNPNSPDDESRENDNSVFSSHHGVRGSILGGRNVKEQLHSVDNHRMSTSSSVPRHQNNTSPNAVSNQGVNYNGTSSEQTASYQDIESKLSSEEKDWNIQSSTAEGLQFSRSTWLQNKPNSSDVIEVAMALENGDYNSHFGGPHDKEYYLNNDPQMHPVMLASHSLRSTISRGTPPSHGRSRGGLKEARTSGQAHESSFANYIGGSVQGTNYQKLMDEMRQKREVELKEREIKKVAERIAKEKRDALSLKDNKTSNTREPTVSTSTVHQVQAKGTTKCSTLTVAKENDSFIPQLSIIAEDESSDVENNSKSSLGTESKDQLQNENPAPSQNANNLSIPKKNEDLVKQMDPLIKLLYQEIAEENCDTTEQSSNDNNDEEESEEGGSEEEAELSRQIIERVRTAIIKRRLTFTDTRVVNRDRKEDSLNETDSILITPPDIETLLKAAEFRGKKNSNWKRLNLAMTTAKLVEVENSIIYQLASSVK